MTTPPDKPKPKRRRFQFSLFSLVAFVTVVCTGLGWLAYERQKVQERIAAIAAVKDSGGNVFYDLSRPFRPHWLRPLLGDNSAGEVTGVSFEGTKISDAELAHITSFTKLEYLFVNNTRITDAGLTHMTGLRELRQLSLEGTQVTDEGLKQLSALTSLEGLNVANTKTTDAGLTHICHLTKLQRLSLCGCKISDLGLVQLSDLPNLDRLLIAETSVTDAGVKRLQRMLPELIIVRL